MLSIAFRAYYSMGNLKSSYLPIEESEGIESSDLVGIKGFVKSELSSRDMSFVTRAILHIVFLENRFIALLIDISINDDRVKIIPTDNIKAIKSIWEKEDRSCLENGQHSNY